jgi:crotonobetainyl-CoA:carnitine CoA-transferase CaiB-like acyl-CoA transferase
MAANEGKAQVPDGILSGVRVIEIANWVAAPSCAALMADMGADVVKLEPPGGDPYRSYMQRAIEYDYPFKTNLAFQLDNRGKRSLTVDLNHADGPGLVKRMCAGADIFICNLLPRRRTKYGLEAEKLLEANPRLIDVTLTGYGTEGPDADLPGYDYSVYWARSGIMALMGEPPSPPALQRGAMGDHTAALNLLGSTLAALRLRDMTGQGQRVEVSLLNTGHWVLGCDIAGALAEPKQPPRHDRRAPPNVLWNGYPTKDDRWVLLVMPQPDLFWPGFAKLMGRPEWADDERFQAQEQRKAHNAELVSEIDKVTRTRTLAEWGPLLDQSGVIWAPVQRITDVVDDPQVAATKRFVPIEHEEFGTLPTVAAPFRLSSGDPKPHKAAPLLDRDTAAIMEGYGFSGEETAKLQQAGVIGE